jgi:hypothetical protein
MLPADYGRLPQHGSSETGAGESFAEMIENPGKFDLMAANPGLAGGHGGMTLKSRTATVSDVSEPCLLEAAGVPCGADGLISAARLGEGGGVVVEASALLSEEGGVGSGAGVCR